MARRAALLLLLLSLAACTTGGTRTVTLVADGRTRTLTTDVLTVGDLLAQASVTLAGYDRVVPPEPTFIEDGMTVRVVRVQVRTEVERRDIPFERRTVRDASVLAGETRLLEPGVAGIEELTYRVTLEDGAEVERQLVRRVVLQEPRAEVILIGVQAELKPVPITGTLAYVANHNAWVIQTTSPNQRRLTHTGDLDGRVFALSPDGSHLLFTRVPPSSSSSEGTPSPTSAPSEGTPPSSSPPLRGTPLPSSSSSEGTPSPTSAPSEGTPPSSSPPLGGTPLPSSPPMGGTPLPSSPPMGGTEGGPEVPPLNTLWLIETATVDAEPIRLDAESVLWAGWEPACRILPAGTGCRIAYTTGIPAEGEPGWEAENDLWIARPRPSDGRLMGRRRIVAPGVGGAYGWWGTTFAWAPDGTRLAYARADEVGVVRSADGAQAVLARFPPYRTYAPWVWTPTVSWSPEAQFVVTTLHGPAPAGEASEEAPVFDVWALAADGTLTATLVSEAGMWAAPAYAPEGESIAFGGARNPRASQTSGYDLYVMDRDGSDRRLLFPSSQEVGLDYPEMAWGPEGDRLVVVYQGNLYLIYLATGQVLQLTAEGGVTAVHWQW